jgi:predicted metal-binding membrane protein
MSTLESKLTASASRDGVFIASCLFAFLATATATVLWCRSMAGGMPMPGGWTMSMAWMRMPGQSWSAAAIMFLAMWTLMMLAMMLPCLTPMLVSYRRSLRQLHVTALSWPTAQAAAGYLAFWALFGALVYPLGIALAMLEMQSTMLSRWVPLASGIVVVLAGIFQLTPWKMGCLNRCRQDEGCGAATGPHAGNTLLHGLRLGAECAGCCLGFMVLLLVLGVMDWRIMAVVTIAITFERIMPRPLAAARIAGLAILVVGLALVVQALMQK